jgi:hypothetical protein
MHCICRRSVIYSATCLVSQKRFGLIAPGAELKPMFWYPQGDVATAFVDSLGIGRDSLPNFARTFAAS